MPRTVNVRPGPLSRASDGMRSTTRQDSNALELLESEDLELRELFGELRQRRGSSAEERAEDGDIAREIVRHVATREAALADVSKVAGQDPHLSELASRINQGAQVRRPLVDRAERMSRFQGINLRSGQDFDSAMEELIQLVGTEIEWELGEALPELRGSFRRTDREDELKSATHIRRHAQIKLDWRGPRWWEGAPVISRLITSYDRWRDSPKGAVQRR
jgi:hypothetical protein